MPQHIRQTLSNVLLSLIIFINIISTICTFIWLFLHGSGFTYACMKYMLHLITWYTWPRTQLSHLKLTFSALKVAVYHNNVSIQYLGLMLTHAMFFIYTSNFRHPSDLASSSGGLPPANNMSI